MPRTVALLAFDGAQILDIVGPGEVFAIANQMTGVAEYRVAVVSADGAGTFTSSGMHLGVESSLADLGGAVDTFIVPGTYGLSQALGDAQLLTAVSAGAAASRRVAAVCGGAFLLGAVGLLDGRRATTHWMFLDDLAERFPSAQVERGPIFTQDGPVFTSAGVTAGIDLALALVEADHGPELARQVARFMVVFMQRPGGQSQFSVRLEVGAGVPSPLRRVLDEISADPAADHRLSALSERAGFSERHLSRLFFRELGTSPARYVEEVRIEAARALLESRDLSLDVIARRSGLGSTETLRRIFARKLGVSPQVYRRRFRTTGVSRATGPLSVAGDVQDDELGVPAR
jgi:transcriptional regulator GlxA family with amidase domain